MVAEPGIGGGRADVHHVLHTVDTLFQRHDDTVQYGFGIGTGVVGADVHCGRCNIRILFHRQRKERDKPITRISTEMEIAITGRFINIFPFILMGHR